MRILNSVISATIIAALPALAHAQSTTANNSASQAQMQAEAKISMDSAKILAKRSVPNATIKSSELERENGHLIYSFDMSQTGHRGIEEVNIDALTGRLRNKHRETAAAEKKEAREEKLDSTKAQKRSARP